VSRDESAPVGKTAALTVRLSAEMHQKLHDLAERGPYRISITSIIERGIELAALELGQMAERAKAGAS